MTNPYETEIVTKFRVGQKIRFKPLAELKEIGVRFAISVGNGFKYFTSDLVVLRFHPTNTFAIQVNADGFKDDGKWFHIDFFQPVGQLPDHLKGKL